MSNKFNIPFIDQNDPNKNQDVILRLKNISVATEMPLQGYRQFGCINCEFRGTSLCDIRIPRSNKISFKELGISFDSICEKKYWYVLSTYTGIKLNPTYKQLITDYNKTMQHDMVIKLRQDIRQIEEKLEDIEENLVNLTKGTNDYYDAYSMIGQLKKEHYLKTSTLFNSITNIEKVRQKDDEIKMKLITENPGNKKISIQQLNVLINSAKPETKTPFIDQK